jgi:beta-lactamase superfamily II metal-dependent hydrolase
MKKVLLFVWNICLFLGAVAFGSNLEVNILSVGCGNFVLLRKDNNVLVIDCGVEHNRISSYIDEEILKSILMGSDNCTVVITHDHEDHYIAASILNTYWLETHKATEAPGRRSMKFFYGWFPSTKDRRGEVVREGVRYDQLPADPNVLNGRLNGVSIQCIIPQGYDKDSHVNNLVIGIKYGDRSFIFPGDANQNWFNKNCKELITLISQLGGVDFLLIPHHGSMSDTGFFMKGAIENLPGNFDEKRLICVISSNPAQTYHIPRQGVQHLFLCEHRDNKVKEHDLSFAKKLGPKNWTVVAEKREQRPVFSTADATYGGYKIVCDGTNFWMYDELGIPRHPGEGIAELKVFDSAGLTTQR